jgi:hypothetical protein
MTRGTAGRGEDRKSHPATIWLAAGDGDVLSTTREQKHLLHHRSHCRYRHCSQSARRVLTHFPVWVATGAEDTFSASEELSCGGAGLRAAHLLEAALWTTGNVPCER